VRWHGDHADCMGRLTVESVAEALEHALTVAL
jgi:hypothetical protein